MTLDDLVKTFDKAYFSDKSGDAERVGIAAVVRALRPAFMDAIAWRLDRRPVDEYLSRTADHFINEILGSDAGEAGESANTVDAQQCHTTTTSSATPILAGSSTSNPEGKKTCLVATPANSFCEWKGVRDSFDYQRGCGGFDEDDPDIGDPCPFCGKTIRFKEETKP